MSENRFDRPLSSKRDRERAAIRLIPCDLGGKAGVIKRLREVLAQEKERVGQPVRSVGSYRWVGSCLVERLSEELDRDPLVAGVMVDSRQPTERSRTFWPRPRVLGSLREERLCSRGVARLEIGRPRLEPSAVNGLGVVLRRQAASTLAELGSGLRCAASACHLRRLVQRRRDRRIGSFRAESEMPCPLFGILHERRQSTMNRPPAIDVRLQRDRRCEQRMDEPDSVGLQLDHLGVDRMSQAHTSALPRRLCDETHRRLRHTRRHEQRLLRLLRQGTQSRPQQLAKFTAHGERLARLRLFAALPQRARELEREERVALRRLMHPLEQRP